MSRIRRVWLCAPAGWVWTILASCGASALGAVPGPPIHFAVVPGADAQPSGPDYDFRISRTEITNAQFAAFLNDVLTTADPVRSAYLHIDTTTGDVYWHTSAPLVLGPPPEPSRPRLFSPAVSEQITFDGTMYLVRTDPIDFSNHPVAGVSWFGAVKYCNWLTLATGLAPVDRAYGESGYPNASEWRPVTIAASDWATRDLNDAERLALLDVAGFRLPMSRAGAGTPAGPFNEWFKAAAWDPVSMTNRQFGFGRDTLSNQDANYLCSGDPFEELANCAAGQTTPVGMFDGSAFGGIFPTNPDENAYGLKDASGNVWEWMQDQGVSPDARDNRGGSFRSAGVSLATNLPTSRDAASLVDSAGFRVVQSGRPALQVTPAEPAPITTVWGASVPQEIIQALVLTNRSSSPFQWLAATAYPWAVLDAPATPQWLAPNATTSIGLSLDIHCESPVTPGTHDVAIAIEDLTNERIELRTIGVTILEPLAVDPAEPSALEVYAGDAASNPISTFLITSSSPDDVAWTATVADTTVPPSPQNWLSVDPPGGTIASGEEPTATVALYANTATLPVGTHTAELVFRDVCTNASFVRAVEVSIVAPMTLAGPIDASFSRSCDALPSPEFHEFALTNQRSEPLPWSASISHPDVFTVTPTSGLLGPGGEVALRLQVAPDAPVNIPSTITGSLSVQTADGGYSTSRSLQLQTNALPVEPATGVDFIGPHYGPYSPSSATFTLRNPMDGELPWSANFIDQSDPPASLTWITPEPAVGVLFSVNDEANIVATLTPETALLPQGTYQGRLVVETPLTPGCASSILIELQVGADAYPLDAAVIPEGADQPNGPVHTFRIGRTEVTNDEFSRFLRDAQSNPNNPRGEYLAFDTTTGQVALSGDGTLLFDPTAAGDIVLSDGSYYSAPGREQLPVSGVSWIGAAKYANWLTLTQGMTEPDQRAFHEGSSVDGWYPIAADPESYFANGLSESEREELATSVFGFRLPMDHNSPGPSLYNEWHCAAAWHRTMAQNTAYGFGRSVLTPSDANYLASCDPFEASGPSPVGYYDGQQPLAAGCGITSETGNYYRLVDLCGNVAEWVLDFGSSPDSRATRGGDFGDAAGSLELRNTTRSAEPATAVSPKVGFRLAQSVHASLPSVSRSPARVRGVRGGPFSHDQIIVQVTNNGPQSLDDVSVSASASWITPIAAGESIIPPQGTESFMFALAAGAAQAMSPPSATDGELVLVSPDDPEPGGPTYAYWVGATEVTNAQFAAFLNDAMADASSAVPGVRSAYMYFATGASKVYINDAAGPLVATGPPQFAPQVLLYDGNVGLIKFSADSWEVAADLANHPVVGVSWFGAVKFCNWKTLHEGLPSSQRAYSEGTATELARWKPVSLTIDAWSVPTLTDADRQLWIDAVTGFRLPLDGGTAGASPFNEWHKAAAWDGDNSVDHVYGFGREALTREDANYFLHTALTAQGTTPAGFFDGVHPVPTTAPLCTLDVPLAATVDSQNFYGLVDVCGNATEWTSELGGEPSLRVVRGGGWRDAVDSALLRTDGRAALLAESVRNDLGFRVFATRGAVGRINVLDGLSATLQTLDVVLDVDDPLTVTPTGTRAYKSPMGAATAIVPSGFEVTNRSDIDIPWSVAVDATWLQVALAGSTAGTLPAQGSISLEAELTAAADVLPPGAHLATVAIVGDPAGAEIIRTIRLDITQPASFITADGDAIAFLQYAGNAESANQGAAGIHLISLGGRALEYSIDPGAPWLAVAPAGALDGILQPGAERSFEIDLAGASAELAIGRHIAMVTARLTDPVMDISWVQSLTVTTDVLDPLQIEPAPSPIVLQRPAPGESLPAVGLVASNLGNAAINAAVGVDVPWLTLSPTTIALMPAESQPVTATLNEACWELSAGAHDAIVTFTDATWSHSQCRLIRLIVGEALSVSPTGVIDLSMEEGGLALPSLIEISVAHTDPDGDPIPYQLSLVFSEEPWLQLVDGGTATAGTLDPGSSADIPLTPLPFVARSLSPGEHLANLVLTNESSGAVHSRLVRLSVVRRKSATSEVHVRHNPNQPGGPAYSFRIGTHPVRNADFVQFLNDALQNLGSAGSEYLYFDLDDGSVYVHDEATAQAGRGAEGHTVRVFHADLETPIRFDGASYVVTTEPTDMAQHPATGVSWYGALKYANWLTLDCGLPAAERAIVEAPLSVVAEWRPATITATDWVARDLNDAERSLLVGRYRGYRLPMDDGHTNSNPATDSADAFNEWFKAAAWNSAASANTNYAFGRNTLSGLDANFRDSGDPFDNGTTPVGYYGGLNGSELYPANENANAFGAYDLCGNVYQWVLGRYNSSPNSIAFRTLRGGSWNDPAAADVLRTTSRTFASPGLTDPLVGFRVARALPPADGDLVLDGTINLRDHAVAAYCLSGPGVLARIGCEQCDLEDDGDLDLHDVARLFVLQGAEP